MDRTCIRVAATTAFAVALGGVALAQTADFLKQEGPDAWRASKLAGVAIYGPDKKKVGDVTDVLLDHAGKATAVVIGVGGFLGIGEKDVALPFDQVTFTQDPLNPPQATDAAGGVATTRANGADTPATTGLGMPADTVGDPNAPGARGAAPGMNSAPSSGAGGTAPTLGSPAASTTGTGVVGGNGMAAVPTGTEARPARSTGYPDHGTITLTADQLKVAPTFAFAR